MISKRFSLSRDLYSAGAFVTVGTDTKILFGPLNAPSAPTGAPLMGPTNARPAIFADRLFISNASGISVIVRPVIPGSAEAVEYPYPNFLGASGSSGANSEWIGYDPTGFAVGSDSLHGITVPSGAIAYPIEVVCIGIVVTASTSPDGKTISWAAYGSNKRS